MKRAPRKRTGSRAKETAALLLSFCKVRILHYAAAQPVPSSGILERLRSHGCTVAPATLNRILLRMSRNGWLKSKPASANTHRRTYSLTPKGRAVLDLARKSLKQLGLHNIKPKNTN
jgi:DNA-binding PadR family transcriptional regulator